MYFYEILQQIMDERSLSIPDVARLSDLADSTIRSILSRKSKSVALEVAFKLATGLNVPIERLNGENISSSVIDLNNFLGNKIQRLLEDNDMKSADLCRETGIPTSLMSNYIKGTKSPGMDNSIKIANVFNITLDELSGRNFKPLEKVAPERIESDIDIISNELSNLYGAIPQNKLDLITKLVKTVLESDI